MRTPILIVLTLAGLLSAGCAGPEIAFTARTRIEPDGRTHRSVRIDSTPARGRPAEEAALQRYLRLPAPGPYDRYDVEPQHVHLEGAFEAPTQVPVDFAKITAGLDLWAQNRLRVRRHDYVLFTTFDFEERIEDIVERAEADEAFDEALGLLVEAVLSALEGRFGEAYDLTRFKDWFRREAPLLARRLYQIGWEIRRSRRGGFDSESETEEWDRRIRQELSRYGLYLAPFDNRAARKRNEARAWEFLDARLSDLVEPRESGTPPLTAKAFQGGQNQKMLLAHLEEAVRGSFGSLDSFLQEIDPLIPVVFGSFFPYRLRLDHRAPEFAFVFRLELPGRIVLSNGVRELDGTLAWRFGDEDLRLAGHPMWARSLLINDAATARLGLVRFPGSLPAVDRFRLAVSGRDGEPDPGALALLREAVEAGDLAPLRRAARPDGGADARDGVPPEQAQVLLGMLSAYYDPDRADRRPTPPATPDASPADTLPPRPDPPPATPDPDDPSTPPATDTAPDASPDLGRMDLGVDLAPPPADRPPVTPPDDDDGTGRPPGTAAPAPADRHAPEEWDLDWPPAPDLPRGPDAPGPRPSASATEQGEEPDEHPRPGDTATGPGAGESRPAGEAGPRADRGDVPAVPLGDGDADADATGPDVQPDDE
ncbi:MAG: hypothetical protein ACOCX4_01915 [Planctomycetota bacterium]